MKAEKLTSSESTKLQTSAVPNNVITYTAKEKLEETNDGLHINAFNVKIESHTFDNGTGTITFAGEVTTIGTSAFYGCSGLISIDIPDSVTTIGEGAFSDCSSLTAIEVDSANQHYTSDDGVLFNHSKDTLICYPAGKRQAAYIIPDSVTKIGYGGFYDCEDLTSIVIPDSVRIIGLNAFLGCKGLASVAIPNSVKVIGYRAFAGCESLTEIIIPNSVTIIGEETFLLCSGLKSIVIPNAITEIESCAFERCERLESITCHATTPPILEEFCFGGVSLSIPVYVPKEAVNAYKNADGWKDFKNILPI